MSSEPPCMFLRTSAFPSWPSVYASFLTSKTMWTCWLSPGRRHTGPGPENPPLVSPILIYAELLATDDDCLREVAAALYEKEIAPRVRVD